jgi:hypothetical protein
MFSSKNKIKINELAELLYITTIDSEYINNIIEKLKNEVNTLDSSRVYRELIVLRIIIVSNLIRSDKLFKLGYEKKIRLYLEYLKHFEEVEKEIKGDDSLIDLVKSRMKKYNPSIERDNIYCVLDIAPAFADFCGANGYEAFVKKIKTFYLNDTLAFAELLRKYKLT